jgi:small subunit ribosomal protein S4
MKIGPKYKIARRLQAPVFEKTQTQKYALRQERKNKKFGKPKSEFATQMNEKQKARFVYGLSEKQFSNYIKEGMVPEKIFEFLENRLDNVVFRLGFAPTRLAARQMVSHGHITVNSRRVTIPSLRVKIGDKIGIRHGSMAKGLWISLDERLKNVSSPKWLSMDADKRQAEVKATPEWRVDENLFDLNAVVEFYSR